MAGKKRVWTDEETAFVTKRVPEVGFRKTHKEFCEKFRKFSMNAIRDRCKILGVSSPNKERGGGMRVFSLTEDEEFSFIALVTDEGYAAAMKEFGVCEETVRRKCAKLETKYEVEIRSPQAQTMRANTRELRGDYFLHWSPSMAYDLGYGFADGSIRPNRYGRPQDYHLKCKRSDEDMILGMRERIGSQHLITRFIETQVNGTKSPMTRIVISNSALARSLVEVHGMHIAKSKRDDPLPSIPEDYLCHFTRGYFDGDGTVWRCDYDYQTNKRGFAFLGTHLFLQQLHDRIVPAAGLMSARVYQDKSTGKAWKMQWQSEEAMQAMRLFMYPAGNHPFLARKRGIFLQSPT